MSNIRRDLLRQQMMIDGRLMGVVGGEEVDLAEMKEENGCKISA